ncbi:MAG: sarcosine oxidase subunit gamma family protein [Pseudomonadota bacterium]
MPELDMEPAGALPAEDLVDLPRDVDIQSTVLAACKPMAMFNLRLDPADEEGCEQIRAAFGLALPVAANTREIEAEREALWLGPDEWLLSAPAAERDTVAAELHGALVGRFSSLSDVSDAFTRLRVSGRHGRDMLAKGCPLDLHPSVFQAPAVAGTVVAKSQATLVALESGAIEVVVRRSFADYLWRWLKHAGSDYGVVIGAL